MKLALGTAQFGLAYGAVGSGAQVTDGEARRILARAWQLGIRTLDTAAAYGDIEQRLAGLCDGRDHAVVSKIPPQPADVRAALERSRQRLGSRLHAVLFHSSADLLGANGDALWAAAAASGLRIGVSCYGPDELALLRGRYPIDIAQLPGNAFDQRLARHCFAGIELHLRSAFLQGLLLAPDAGARRVPAAAAALQRWQRSCQERDLSPLVAALGAVQALPGVAQVVVGVETVAQLEQVAAAWQRAAPLALPELASDDPAVIDPRRWTLQP